MSPLISHNQLRFVFFFQVGSRYENPEQNGISHFLEHLLFTGTKKRPSRRIISELGDMMGGEMNAGTTKEYTVFHTHVAREQCEEGFDLLADMLQNSLLNEEDIEKERAIISEEIDMHYDIPQGYLSDVYDSTIWGDTSLGKTILGTKDSIASLTRDDFLSFMKKYYTNSKLVIGIGGLYDKGKVIDLVERLCTSFSQQAPISFPPCTYSQTSAQIALRTRDIEQTHLCFGFRALRFDHPDRYVQMVLDTILGGTMSSRLFSIIREDLGLAYAVESESAYYSDVGTLFVYAAVQTENVPRVLEKIVEQFCDIKKNGVTEEELEKAKTYLKAKLYLHLDSPEMVTSWLAQQELIYNCVRLPHEIARNIENVTKDQVQTLAQRIFLSSQANVVTVGSFDKQQVVWDCLSNLW